LQPFILASRKNWLTSPGDRLPKNATHPIDPQRPDDDFMGEGCLLIFKLPFAEN
jgi:hypothetical protein